HVHGGEVQRRHRERHGAGRPLRLRTIPARSAALRLLAAQEGAEPVSQIAWKDKWPTVAILSGCLPLQRFALPLGEFKLPLVVPITACVFGVLAMRGRLIVSRQTLLWYSAFCAYG